MMSVPDTLAASILIVDDQESNIMLLEQLHIGLLVVNDQNARGEDFG